LPQFFGSLVVSTHAPLQDVAPASQVHLLAEQAWRAPHAVPHLPQLFGSLVGSTQPFAQASSAPGQAQALFAHVSGEVQTVPHLPQLLESVVTSMQSRPHATAGGVQVVWHLPALHTSLTEQAWPQAPQFPPSRVGSTHTPEHEMSPAAQPHLLATQVPPVPQFAPQAPQLFGSAVRSMH